MGDTTSSGSWDGATSPLCGWLGTSSKSCSSSVALTPSKNISLILDKTANYSCPHPHTAVALDIVCECVGGS